MTALKAIVGTDVDDEVVFLRKWQLPMHMGEYRRDLTPARHIDQKSPKAWRDFYGQEASHPLRVREVSANGLDPAEQRVQFGRHRFLALAVEDPPQAKAGATDEDAEYDEPAQSEGDDTQKYRGKPF